MLWHVYSLEEEASGALGLVTASIEKPDGCWDLELVNGPA